MTERTDHWLEWAPPAGRDEAVEPTPAKPDTRRQIYSGCAIAVLAGALAWGVFGIHPSEAAAPVQDVPLLCGKPNPAPNWTELPVTSHQTPWEQATTIDVPTCATVVWHEDGIETQGRQLGTEEWASGVSITNRYRVRSTTGGRIVHYMLAERPGEDVTADRIASR
ncbi:MAG: hypothetical protein JO294_03335 [Alphaproteobacteria bacterium]|nr:hypothetical protein [Alphaproteobacteria bacterium]